MHYLQRLLLVFLFFLPTFLYAQLAVDGVIDDPGDIAFLALQRSNATGMDGYAFVFLDDAPAGTAIIFDDEEWNGTGWVSASSEGANTWTNNTGAKIPIGTVIIIENGDNSPTTNIGSVTESNGGFSLAEGHDGIFAYVGTFRDPNVDFLAFAGEISAGGNSLVGTGLTANLTALDDESLNTNSFDEGIYTAMSCCTGDQTNCLQMLHNPANWTLIGNNGTSFPTSVSSSIAVPEAAPTVTPSKTTTCGEQISLGIDGCLNKNTEWTVYTGSCGGTEVATTTGTSVMVTPSATTTYYIRGENTVCGTTVGTCKEVTVTVDKVSTAAAGTDQTKCDTETFTMAATAPTDGTGAWTLSSGTATIATPASTTSTVTVAAGNTAELKWTVSNGSCTSTEDIVKLTNNAPPTTAAAGADQSQCNSSTFTMAATPATVGTGAWTVSSGSATITTPTSPTTTVTVPAGMMAELKWTVSATGCPNSEDIVKLTNNSLQTTAVAGADQSQCENALFTMAATNATSGTGAWTVSSGTATIANPTSPTTSVSVPVGMAELKWTVAGVGCPDSEDIVKLSNNANPTADIVVTENSETPDDNIVCIGDKATLTASGGTSFAWDTDASLSATDIAAPLATPSAMTTYTVTVTDDNNCSSTAATTLDVGIKVLALSNNKDNNLDIVDPCSCGNPLNQKIGGRTFFHDILTVSSTPGRTIWISVADDQFRDIDNNRIAADALPTANPGGNATGIGTGTVIPETSVPGVYQLDFYHFERIATTITVTDGTATETFTSGKCNSCIIIPTMNEWGLFIFGLLLLNLGIGLVQRKEALIN